MIAFEDFVDETFTLYITVDGKAKSSELDKDLRDEAVSLGFNIKSEDTQGDTIALELEGTDAEQLVNSPAVLVGATLDDNGPPIYDCG